MGSKNINDLLDSESEYYIKNCVSINDQGQMLCSANKDGRGIRVVVSVDSERLKVIK